MEPRTLILYKRKSLINETQPIFGVNIIYENKKYLKTIAPAENIKGLAERVYNEGISLQSPGLEPKDIITTIIPILVYTNEYIDMGVETKDIIEFLTEYRKIRKFIKTKD